MKIAMINTELNRGGAAKTAHTLMYSLNKYDPNTKVKLYHCGDSLTDESSRGLKRPFAYYASVLQSRLRPGNKIYDFGVTNQIIQETKNVDVIHLHNLHGYYLNYQKLLENIIDKPVVWTWHDMWGATGRCAFSLNCDNWRTECRKCERKYYYPATWIDHAATEFTVKSRLLKTLKSLIIVSPSRWLADIAKDAGFPPERIEIIPNPLNIDEYNHINRNVARVQLNINENTPILLFVAHDCNDERKGYSHFENIIVETGYKGIAIGIPPRIRNNNIIYPGLISSSQLMSYYYSAADAFLITSSSDNYPNTVIESLACGTPVFGYAVGGIPSQIPDIYDGLVDYGDIHALSEKVVTFLSNSNHNDGFIESIASHAVSEWNPETIANRYLKVYEKVLDIS